MAIIDQIKKGQNILNFILPSLYLLLTFSGVLLYFLSRLWGNFNLSGCANLGGREMCMPIGIYLSTMLSLPGYLILGSFLNITHTDVNLYLSYFLLIFVNILCYFFMGLALREIYKYKDNPEKLSISILVSSLVFLTVVLFVLLTI